MNTKLKTFGATLATLLIAVPAFAQTTVIAPTTQVAPDPASQTAAAATVDAKVQARITSGKQRADQEIDRRVKALTDVNVRVQAMERVSSDIKSQIARDVAMQIGALNQLKIKIDGDLDIDTLKTDIKSITTGYRIFLLIIPQSHILVVADKIKTTDAIMTDYTAKLQARIAEAESKGKDTKTLTTTLSELNAKLADATLQADAAVTLVATLAPDGGDKTKMQDNSKALKDARAKLKAGLEDLKTARKDAGSIVKSLKSMHLDGAATSTVSASTTTP